MKLGTVQLFEEYKKLLHENLFDKFIKTGYKRYKIGRGSIRVWLRGIKDKLFIFIAPFDHKSTSDRFKVSLYLANPEYTTINVRGKCYSVQSGIDELSQEVINLISKVDKINNRQKITVVGFSMGGSIAWGVGLKLYPHVKVKSYGSFGITRESIREDDIGVNIGICNMNSKLGLCYDPIPLLGPTMLPTVMIVKSLNTLPDNFVKQHALETRALLNKVSDNLDILDLTSGYQEVDRKNDASPLEMNTTSALPLPIDYGWSKLHDLEKYLKYTSEIKI